MNIIRGIAYPLTKHPQGFFHNAADDLTQIKSDMAAIILTEPEERIFEPYFGVDFSNLNLNQPKELVASDARIKIAVALKKWEKRVQVNEIYVQLITTEAKELVLKIHVFFIDPNDIRNTNDLLVYKSLGSAEGKNLPY